MEYLQVSQPGLFYLSYHIVDVNEIGLYNQLQNIWD